MSKTASKMSSIEDEYTSVITELVSQAVAPSLRQFEQTTSIGLTQSTEGLLQAKQHLVKQTDLLGKNLEDLLKSYLNPTRDAMDDIRAEMKPIAAQLESMNSKVNNYQEMVRLLERDLTALSNGTSALMEKTLEKTVAEPLAVMNDASIQGFSTSVAATVAARDALLTQIEQTNQLLKTELQSQTGTFFDSIVALTEKADATNSALKSALGIVGEYRKATEDALSRLAGQASSIGGHLAEMEEKFGREATRAFSHLLTEINAGLAHHSSSLQQSITVQFQQMEQLGGEVAILRRLLSDEQASIHGLHEALPVLQKEILARTQGISGELDEINNGLKRTVQEAQSVIIARIKAETGVQAEVVVAAIAKLNVELQSIRTKLHSLQDTLATQERSLESFRAQTESARASVVSQIASLGVAVGQLKTDTQKTLVDVTASMTGAVLKEFQTKMQEADVNRRKLHSLLQDQSRALHKDQELAFALSQEIQRDVLRLSAHTENQFQQSAREQEFLKRRVNVTYLIAIAILVLVVFQLGWHVATITGLFTKSH